MAKFIEVTPRNSYSEIKRVIIHIDQIVAIEKLDRIYRIITTAIHPIAHGTASLAFDITEKEYEEKVMDLLS